MKIKLLLLGILICLIGASPVMAISQYDLNRLNTDSIYFWGNQQCSGSGSTASVTLVGSDNVQKAYNYLTGKGLSPVQVAGIIGNLEQESGQGLNPSDQQNGASTSLVPVPNIGFGIAQWTDPGRQQGLVQLAAQEGKPPSDLGVQLDYLWQELNTTHSNALAGLKVTTNVTDATTTFETLYEGAGTPNLPNRIMYAQAVLSLYGPTSATTGSVSSTAGSSICATTAAAINCSQNGSTTTSDLSSIRQNVVCLAQQELALWESQPGYPTPAYSETGYLKYSQNVPEEWCADFVSWLYDQAGYPITPDPDWKVSAVRVIESIGMANQNFHWHPESSNYVPKPGDLAIHSTSDNPDYHVNMYISTSGGIAQYIGGDQGSPPYPGGSNVSIDTGNGYYDQDIIGYVSPD